MRIVKTEILNNKQKFVGSNNFHLKYLFNLKNCTKSRRDFLSIHTKRKKNIYIF